MVKSLLFITTICSLNANSFNIQPKEVQWSDNVTQEATYITNNTINATRVDAVASDYYREIDIYDKAVNKYKDNYIEIDEVTITDYHLEFQVNENDDEILDKSPIQKIVHKYTTYKSFSNNADIYNYYNNESIYTNFSDNKATTYNISFDLQTPVNPAKRYTATNDTKLAITNIKLASTMQELINAETQFQLALGNTTSSNLEVNQITNATNTLTINQEIEGNETTEIYTYTRAFLTDFDFTITYNGQVLDTNEKLSVWYNNFFEIINGQRVFTYSANTTTRTIIQNMATLDVDSGSAQPTEPIDLGGLMWDIIGMPFTFINQAFNVTLFAGTIYEFNIGTLFKGLIAIMAVLFVVKLFTKGIDVIGAYTGSVQDASFKRENQQMKREQHQMNKESHAKEMAKKDKK